jgi:hypothetical protein
MGSRKALNAQNDSAYGFFSNLCKFPALPRAGAMSFKPENLRIIRILFLPVGQQ